MRRPVSRWIINNTQKILRISVSNTMLQGFSFQVRCRGTWLVNRTQFKPLCVQTRIGALRWSGVDCRPKRRRQLIFSLGLIEFSHKAFLGMWIIAHTPFRPRIGKRNAGWPRKRFALLHLSWAFAAFWGSMVLRSRMNYPMAQSYQRAINVWFQGRVTCACQV